MYVYITHKYELLILCNATCMYIFRAAHLELSKELMCSFLGMTIAPALNISLVVWAWFWHYASK